MKEIVINKCFGGFGLSHKAIMKYAEKKGIKLYPEIDEIYKKIYGKEATLDNPEVFVHYYKVDPEEYRKIKKECEENEEGYKRLNGLDYYFSDSNIPRDDKDLIDLIIEMGKNANSRYSELEIIEIPDDVEWEISEYDGMETIEEKHRSWG